MLVLHRSIGQKVILDTPSGRIIVTLTRICDGRSARIGFEAPPDVQISREEILPDPLPGEWRGEPKWEDGR